MIQNYYPLDFEAQYEETSEKMIEISKMHKDIILNQLPLPIPDIEHELEDLQEAIENADLQFKKQSIYSQFASGQLMAQRRKKPPEMCPQCGDELKKQVQCQFCAELFCKKCCNRSRVIPFVSKQSRLCCEQCHWKFVKHFDNAEFYEEKEKLVNVMNFVRNKVNKIGEKITAKKKEVEDIKNERRNDKIKEKIVEKKIQDEEKRLKQLEEQLKQAVLEKAEKIREAQIRQKQLEQEQERQRLIRLEQQRRQEENLRHQRQEALKREQEIARQQIQREKQLQTKQEQEERKRVEEQKKRQEQIRRQYEQQMRKKNQELEELKRLVQQQSSAKKSTSRKLSESSSKSGSKRQPVQNETPKQTAPKQSYLNQKLVNTEETSQSNKSNKQKSVKSVKESEDGSGRQRNVKKSTGSNKADQTAKALPMLSKLKSEQVRDNHSNHKGVTFEQKREAEPESEDALEKSLANMLKVKKDEDIRSVSNLSRTSKNIIDMSVNDLLAMRIPPPSSKAKPVVPEIPEKAEGSSNEFGAYQGEEEPRSPLSPTPPQRTSVNRNSLKLVQNINETTVDQKDLEVTRRQLIQNSSLLSSANRQSQEGGEEEGEARKCQCLVM